jgi:hypothetical protein
MAKTVKPYEIDFKFLRNKTDILFNEDGTERYTDRDLADAVLAQHVHLSAYDQEFIANVDGILKRGETMTDNQRWHLKREAAYFVPHYEEYTKKFFDWYDSRPDMQDMYASCTTNSWWFYDIHGNHKSKEEAAALGWDKRPNTVEAFERVANGWEGSKYRELKRDIVFDVGDQVVLRKPFVGTYRYDPIYYSQEADKTADRIGMVVQHKEEISRRSRGGKGSRMINVLWLNTGETKTIPERCIKKFRQKDLDKATGQA